MFYFFIFSYQILNTEKLDKKVKVCGEV